MRHWAEALIALHLDDSWTFGFDAARARAGLCDHTRKRISVSKHAASNYTDDEIHQVLLHEVAHALAGARAGHGPRWKTIARDLGYDGGRTVDTPIAPDLANWIGRCPNGHEYSRHRRPSRDSSCSKCSRTFDPRFRIAWRRREPAA